ncbi:sugar O-acetyltransferase [Erysipelothrix rhusiopathiae]|nr:sugar O-acetyltransferase [Erysipelothrix rhusiopathiae]MDE8041373.1 sugar O-acetyltransferase [Erysipelothrix rhusiopathiae]MDE8049919.1 sugar O-acetyltransferase [Erysipelothrix rhusiopathiae]MDE8058242.1 sugar O-acetyltransferase [Erysipelothrix rhusiopathiae]MDE8066099.1 sugar O-acetyltransferase [Erysipelothrix rhusiopathiae]
MQMFEKMIRGDMYRSDDPTLMKLNLKAIECTIRANQEANGTVRSDIYREILGSAPETFCICPDFACDYGVNIHLGDHFFANHNCVMLDVCEIRFGDYCMCGPNVQIYTATHPLDPSTRSSGWEYGKPVSIGNNVWLGGSCILLPGVSLGDNVVVGAGSVVTQSFGDNVVLAGNPAKIIKTIQ